MAENLVEVDYRVLSLQEALQALLDGKVVLIKGMEQSRNLDVLARIYTDGVVPVTQISYDVTPADGYWRDDYWQIFDLSINALSTYPCYVYDAETANNAPKFLIGTTVYYTSKTDSTRDSAIVLGLYKDEENKWYYKLSRDEEIYAETELTADRL